MSDHQPMNSLEALAWKRANSPASLTTKASRVLQIFQHYNLLRIARRGANTIPRKLFPNRLIGTFPVVDCVLRKNEQTNRLAKLVSDFAAKHPSHSKCVLDAGSYTLLNHSVDLGHPQQWEKSLLQKQPHLWRFQLHYHEFLLCHAANNNWPAVNSFLSQWILKFAPEVTLKRDDAWHPYCLSRRIVAWTWLLYLSEQNKGQSSCGLGAELFEQILKSLMSQANYLSKNLERDLGGNHLLENAAALAILGGSTECSQSASWISTATNILAAELPKQILQHGEHFELAPMYHCQMLGALLRIKTCCNQHSNLVALLDQHIDPMLEFIISILHPDGEIPLLADSGFYEAPSVSELLAVAKLNQHTEVGPAENKNCKVGGYQIFRTANTYAIADFGPLAADGLPAHGHCDAFNLELSVARQRWIVDSGNFNYENDSMRHYCRSSIGHNVVTIDNINQANIWSKFRMGHRPTISNFQSGSSGNWQWASAAHDGYAKVGAQKLTRFVASTPEIFACVDKATLNAYHTNRKLVGYLHLHPDIKGSRPKKVGENRFELETEYNELKRFITFFAADVSFEQGWYCERFGDRRATTVIRYVTDLANSITGWIFQESPNACEIELRDDAFVITIAGLNELKCPIKN